MKSEPWVKTAESSFTGFAGHFVIGGDKTIPQALQMINDSGVVDRPITSIEILFASKPK